MRCARRGCGRSRRLRCGDGRAEGRRPRRLEGIGRQGLDEVWFDIAEEHGGTEFTGYRQRTGRGQVIAIVKDGKRSIARPSGDEVMLVTNQTPFYGESGGQMGDAGTIRGDDGLRSRSATRRSRSGGFTRMQGVVKAGTIKVGDALQLSVDGDRRSRIRANHSATHLLHAALRNRLGGHVTQKGSLVAPIGLRFDFSHPKPMTAEDIAVVEAEVNRHIRENERCDDPADDPRRRDRRRRDGAVRREIWRRGPRALDGAGRHQQLFGRAVRRHPCVGARRYRPVQDHRRERGVQRRPPHRGADRRRRARLAQRP
jgi:Ser-tRNA(Ala) deacylase AlaX